MKRAMIFIDGSNVFFDWNKINSGISMNIEKYIDLVKSKFPNTDFIRTYYFTSETSSNTYFLQQVNSIPYCEVIKGRLQEKPIKLNQRYGVTCSHCGTPVTDGEIVVYTDKGTDVNIAVEMLKHAYNDSFDFAVLISRDADFTSVVKIIKNLGKNVELVLFEGSKDNAQELSANADHIVLLSSEDCSACTR